MRKGRFESPCKNVNANNENEPRNQGLKPKRRGYRISFPLWVPSQKKCIVLGRLSGTNGGGGGGGGGSRTPSCCDQRQSGAKKKASEALWMASYRAVEKVENNVTQWTFTSVLSVRSQGIKKGIRHFVP